MSRSNQDRFGQEIPPASSQTFLYVPRSKQLVPSPASGTSPDDVLPNPIAVVSSSYFLYVPRAHIIVPYGAPAETFYIITEDSFDLATEDGSSFLRLES